jgi:hypothetical protein
MAFGKGKKNNVTGTQPKNRQADAPGPKPDRQDLKEGRGRGAGRGKHAAQDAAGAKTSLTRKAGPRKTPRGTTTRSGEK